VALRGLRARGPAAGTFGFASVDSARHAARVPKDRLPAFPLLRGGGPIIRGCGGWRRPRPGGERGLDPLQIAISSLTATHRVAFRKVVDWPPSTDPRRIGAKTAG